ncbi:MAG: hypothetical protein M3436_01465 [Pseudomonadota bacterium]|nr:hypothetical protein [Pseudomonadota bacterium]
MHGKDLFAGIPFIRSQRGIPKILDETRRRIKKYEDDPLAVFPELAKIRGGNRVQYKQRRRACMRALDSLLEFMQLVCMRVGDYNDDGTLTGRLTAELLKINELLSARFYRAMRDLIKAGLVTSTQQRIPQPDGTWTCLPAIRVILDVVFARVGMLGWLNHERRRAAQRLFKRVRKAAIKAANALKKRAQTFFRKAKKNATHILKELRAKHPELSAEQLFDLVKLAQAP